MTQPIADLTPAVRAVKAALGIDPDREAHYPGPVVNPGHAVPGHVIVPAVEYEQLAAVAEAARAYVASEATRNDATIAHDEWLRGNREALDALTATVNALDAPEATDG